MTKLFANMALPRFYAMPIFAALALKSGVDAFYESNGVKYLYFMFLLFGVFLLRTGKGFERSKLKSEGSYQSMLWLVCAAYFSFLTLLMFQEGGSPQMVFKIVSPFIFFGLVVAAKEDTLPFAMAVGAVLNIVGNAALMPFDYGWIYWGAVHTFKGFYLFKTDLAYSVASSLLVYAAWVRFKVTPMYVVLATLCVIEVVLANSRMNYITLLIVLVFIAVKNGTRWTSLLGYGAFFGVLAGVAMLLYDPSKVLGFDTSNMESFTQGRDRIVSVLWKYGLSTYSPLELLFGRGLFADLIIYMENVSDGEAYGAHNDYLFQVMTQGITGPILNILGWWLVYKIANSAGRREWATGLAAVGFLLYLTQGFTTTTSLYALKTWPLATVLLMIYCSPDDQRSLEPRRVRTKPKPTAVSLV
jgi:hypothetical protein